MSIPHDSSLAANALQLLNSALSALKQTREAAKNIKDSSIKGQISTIYDYVLELKEKLLELNEENAGLRRQLAEKESVRRDSRSGLLYKTNESDPLCPKCYQTTGKKIYLDPPYTSRETGRTSRYCCVCRDEFYDP